MKNFALHEMLILSHRERRARRIRFHPKATIIKGDNDTGKSSLIKAIYYTFGAEPQKMHPRWHSARTISLIRFSVDEKAYFIFRSGKSFSLFNRRQQHVVSTERITDGIGREVAKILDFQLVLADRRGKSITPPPNYLFTPFYVDQDQGWSKTWNSFGRMSQIPNWRRELVYYYTGLRPNQYYALQAEGRSLEADREPISQKIEVLLNVRRRLATRLSTASFDIDIQAYKTEIDRLLVRCEELKKREESYREKLVALDTERIRLEAQKEIVTGALSEISSDYVFATHELEEDHISCPTCGAHYDNSFAERFHIASDEDLCLDLLSTLREDLGKVDARTTQHRATLGQAQEDLAEINRLLESRQGEVTLKTLVENEGRRELATQLDDDLAKLRRELTEINIRLTEVERKAKRYTSKEHARRVNDSFRGYIRRFLSALKVENVPESSYKRVDSVLKETGSDLPRAVLAQTFARLRLIRDDGNATFCPLVIDSPNQQDQDEDNHMRMLHFVKRQQPRGTQLILGLVDDCDVDFGGDVIRLEEKNFALSESQYTNVSSFLKPFEKANLFPGQA